MPVSIQTWFVYMPWFVYMLECANGRLYIGITTDLAARFEKHCSGKGAMFTRLNRPARLLAATVCADRSAASKLEYAAKQLSVAEKRRLAVSWAASGDLIPPQFKA